MHAEQVLTFASGLPRRSMVPAPDLCTGLLHGIWRQNASRRKRGDRTRKLGGMPVPGDYFGNDTSKFRCPLAEHIGSELMPIRRAKTSTLKPGDIALNRYPL